MPLLDLTNQPADLCWQSHADILGPTAVDFDVLRPIGDPTPTRAQLDERKARSRAIISAKRNRAHAWLSSANRTISGPQVPRAFDIASHVKPH